MSVTYGTSVGGGGPVRVGDRMLWREFAAHMEWDDGRRLQVQFRVVDGVPRCSGLRLAAGDLTAGASEITQGDLRAVNIADLLEFAAARTAMPFTVGEDGLVTMSPAMDERTMRASIRTVQGSRTRRKVDDDFLRRVAAVYREHVDDRPTKAVERVFGVRERTASLYVNQARAGGFLGPAVKGKAGEQQ